MFEFVAAGRILDGIEFAVGSDGSTNCIKWLDGTVQNWKGARISCACAFHHGVICISNLGEVWHLNNHVVEKLPIRINDIAVFGAVSITGNRVIAVGQRGSFVEINVDDKSLTIRKAKELGFPKPGRDLINLIALEHGLAAIGKKELIYDFDDYPTPSGSSNSTGRETFFFDGTEWQDRIWLTGLLGREGVLASYTRSTGNLEYHDMPDRMAGRAACIATFQGNLVTANRRIFVGGPGDWRLSTTSVHDNIIAIISGRPNKKPLVVTTAGVFHQIEC